MPSTSRKTSRARFGTEVSRAAKRTAGRTPIERTPLVVRTAGVDVTDQLREHVDRKMAAKLGDLAERIKRISVRLEDVNGPRGGVDKLCRIKVVLSGIESVVHEAPGRTVRHAVDRAAGAVDRAVRRSLDRARTRGRIERLETDGAVPSAKRGELASDRKAKQSVVNPAPKGGSLIGRRVGRGPKNLEAALERPEKLRRDALVDTSAQGVSATDRRAGGRSTARRNSKRNTARATAALEDSVRDRPSRKSTRKSANRAKRDSNLKRRQTRATAAPRARAERAAARKR